MSVNQYYDVPPRSLAGRVAIVTGGGRGIGRATALALAAAGAAVCVSARSVDQIQAVAHEIAALGTKALAVPADVTDRVAVERMVRQTETELGPVDILVNNAGSADALGPIWEVDPNVWWHDIETNLRGTFLCSQAVLPSMRQRQSGRIINISSGAGTRPVPFMSSYTCAKAAILRFTDTLAAETKECGIKVFAIAPSYVRTEMTVRLIGTPEGEKYAQRFQTMPEENWQPPERAAGLVAYLATGAADALSGRFISVLDDIDDLIRRAETIERDDTYALRLRK
jgi:NAD(P)-dependent dehydrogenase (short-subunit alcohol dehydrogenase family)